MRPPSLRRAAAPGVNPPIRAESMRLGAECGATAIVAAVVPGSRRGAAALILASAVLTGCSRASRADTGLTLSSETSDYSPAVRLSFGALLAPDSTAARREWQIRVDSALVSAPGAYREGSPPIMREIRITALLVRFGRLDATPRAEGLERPWTVLARGDEVPLADSLRYGERLRVTGPWTLTLPAAPLERVDGTGLVFEITAAAVSQPIRMANGALLPGRVTRRGVRVFACSAFRLDGRIDRRRARALASRYTAVC